MKLKYTILNLLIIIYLNLAFSQNNILTEINGVWVGQGYQLDLNETWSVMLIIDEKEYKISYPSLNCTGRLQIKKIGSNMVVFEEVITSGDCTNNGILIIEKLSNQKLIFK